MRTTLTPSRRRAALALLLAVTMLLPTIGDTTPDARARDGVGARIINGTPVATYRSAVALATPGGQLFCAGTLVHPSWVLTAAHCVHEDPDPRDDEFQQRPISPDDVIPAIGLEDLRDLRLGDDDAEIGRVTEVVVHPGWRTDLPPQDYVVQGDDLALLRLAQPSAQPVQPFADVGEDDRATPGTGATVHGYGLNNRGLAQDYRGEFDVLAANGTSPVLLSTDVPVGDCPELADGLLCAGDPEPYDGDAGGGASRPPGNDGCNGDSGGPLTVDDGNGGRLQVGLVSFGFVRCGYTDGQPAGYTDLAVYAQWIHDTIGPMATIDAVRTTTFEDGEDLEIDVVLTRPLDDGQPTTVELVVQELEATDPDDFTGAGDVSLDLSGTDRATLALPVVDDAVHEPDETLRVVDDRSPIAIIGLSTELTIRDDDRYAMSSPGGVTVAEPTVGDVAVPLEFTLDRPAEGFERFRLVRDGGDATVGVDHRSVPTVAFQPGATSATAEVRVLDDDAIEAAETATFRVTDAEGVTESSPVTVTITDDDQREVRVLAGDDRLATAIEVARDTFDDDGTDTVVLASARSFPDALVGTPLAVARRGPMLLTEPDRLDGRVLDEVRRVLRPDGELLVLGGRVAVSDEVLRALVDAGLQPRRLAGPNRYATAVEVAEEVGADGAVFLATGRDFPDALAAGAAAANADGVVLLTDDGAMPLETLSFLLGATGEVVAVGGQAASAAPRATPVVGATRYETAALVARTFFDDPASVGLATGQSFPDALGGGVAAGSRQGPLVLTNGGALSPETASYLDDLRPDLVRVLGGEVAIADPVVARAAELTDARVVR